MLAISANRRAVREALADEGWRFAFVRSIKELRRHRNDCRSLTLPVGNESDDHSRTIRERLLARMPWQFRGQPAPRWLTYISAAARKKMQPHLPLAAEFCLRHGFIFLLGDLWAERLNGEWRPHREDGPAVILTDAELYFWRGWQVEKRTLVGQPSAERILKEANQTEREVLIQRMGVEHFVKDAGLKPVDSFRDTTLLKVDTAERRNLYRDGEWTTAPLELAFLKVVCPSTQKAYFLRVDPSVGNAKEALESTLPGYRRDWEHDLIAET